MRGRSLLLVALAFAMVSLAFAGTTPEVITLTDENFHDSLAAAPDAVWLVEFYAPWCGHCKRLAPIWDELAIALHARDDVEFRIAKVDCTENESVATRFAIRGFPTIKLINGGNVYDVNVPRTVNDFTNFAADKEAWKTGTPLPAAGPKVTGGKRVQQQEQEAATTSTDFSSFVEQAIASAQAVDVNKVWNDALKLPFSNPYAAGTLVVIGFLMGLLAALLVCFPTPRIVNLQLAEDAKKPAAAAPKVKAD